MRSLLHSRVSLFVVWSVALLLCIGNATLLRAQSVDELQSSIVQSTQQIDNLKAQIAELQKQLDSTSKNKQTLQNAINALNLNIKKIQAQISLTNTQIKQKDAQINQISGSIATTSSEMTVVQREIGTSLAELERADNEPLAFTLLGGGTLSDIFDHAASLGAVRLGLRDKVKALSHLKSTLESNKSAAQNKRQELSGLQQNLSQQNTSLGIAKQTQNELLAKTKDQEALYQQQIAQKKAQEAKFESDLLNFESQLNLKVSASSLPKTGQGALEWPLDHVNITQYFGNTPFATANPQVYSGKGHTGIDLAASPGTRILAARDGVVLGTGNTDATCPGASFGKWIFVKHDNGLSTLYAHLSSFAVSKGDHVTTGQVIGYSDTTGYATGPHLHFGVYASSGSEIASFPSSSCKGKIYTMPVGDPSAYLNPLSYLPAIP
jgi:murein DD-endopeptidase MepM/ murein hydrolase activator NlpD